MASTTSTVAIKTAFAEAIFNEIASNRSRYYYAIGKPVAWPDDDNPPEPQNSIVKERDARSVIINTKKIQSNDAVLVSRRIDWTFGKVFDRYDDELENLADTDFYAITSDFSVYKCLDNNDGSPSTVEPFGFDIEPIETDDGYRWKYIYTIPAQLRTKFLSGSFFPVVNTLSSRYYSRGSINSINIKNAGTGYTQGDTSILINGNGFLEANPTRITTSIINTGGSGYTSIPVIDISKPFTQFFDFLPSITLPRGTVVRAGRDYYRTLNTGVTGATAPTHFSGDALNGTVNMTYVATEASGSVDIDDTAIGSALLVNAGFGYTTPPLVIISGNGNGATATTVVQDSELAGINIQTTGTGYTTSTITIAEPFSGYKLYANTLAVSDGDIVKYINSGTSNYYLAQNSGTLGVVPPTHVSGVVMNNDVSLLYIGTRASANAVYGIVTNSTLTGFIQSVHVSNGGTGYTTANLVFSGGGGTGAVGNVVLSGGKVVSVVITNRGTGYTSPPTATISGNGTGAVLLTNLEFGYGYNSAPTFTVAAPANPNGVEASVIVNAEKTEAIIEPIISNGQLVGVNVIDGGVGYTTAVLNIVGGGVDADAEIILAVGDIASVQANTELFTSPLSISGVFVTSSGFNISSLRLEVMGDGTGAELEGVIEDGSIKTIRVLSEGTGYTYAYVNAMYNEGATPATFRVVISPPKGHGSDPVKELYSSSVAFFAGFAGDLNQGIVVKNDQRQVCILRNPFKFDDDSYLERSLASACYKISASYSAVEAELFEDDVIEREGDGARFRVIDTSDSGDEVLLQEIDASVISANDRFSFLINGTPYFITATEVVSPQIDKYSGDLLFLNNVRPFTVTENQAVTVRTLITF